MGKKLYIDLTSQEVDVGELAEETASKFIGGSGLGSNILFHEAEIEEHPLSPNNPLIFAVGPLTGTAAFNSNRFEVVARSPLTGIYGESNCGGFWGESFKRSGYDALIITGKSEKPIVVYIDENQVKIESADDLWGKDTFETDRLVKQRWGSSAQAAVIGPAGENGVLISSIMTDGVHGRAAGRCGLGAVMGSKNVKAVVVNGKKKVGIAQEEDFRKLIGEMARPMKDDTIAIKEYGTSGAVDFFEEIGNLPIKNWYQGNWDGAKRISGQHMAETILSGTYHCGRCVLHCGRVVRAVGGPYDGQEIGGPEYETIGMFGSNCLIDDLSAIAKSNELCNRYGLDTISTGSVIAFAMEAFEKGSITREDTGGIALNWGNSSAVFQIIEMIAHNRGLGKTLARGVRKAAQEIGGIAEEFALHVKGLEPAAHDPRAKFSVALGYATSNRGACHLQAFCHDYEDGLFMEDLGAPKLTDRFGTKDRAEHVIRFQHLMTMFDSLICCKFVIYGGMTVSPLTKMISYITGWKFNENDFMMAGERIFNLKRLYNVRLGISRKDDTLPLRMLYHIRGGGSNEIPPLNIMLNEYYNMRGWDEFGIPTDDTCKKLGIAIDSKSLRLRS
jgi:aldehyde:ferredoxin oxidoreductase